jgi:hypothetical protein
MDNLKKQIEELKEIIQYMLDDNEGECYCHTIDEPDLKCCYCVATEIIKGG